EARVWRLLSPVLNEAAGNRGLPFNLHYAINVDAWRDYNFRVNFPELSDFMDGCNGEFGCSGHDGTKVASRFAIDQIAPAVTAFCLDEGDVAIDGFYEHILTAIDFTCFAAGGQFGAESSRAEEAPDAGTSGAQSLGQGALRNQFQFKLARAVELIENVGVGLTGEAANDFAHFAGLEQS